MGRPTGSWLALDLRSHNSKGALVKDILLRVAEPELQRVWKAHAAASCTADVSNSRMLLWGTAPSCLCISCTVKHAVESNAAPACLQQPCVACASQLSWACVSAREVPNQGMEAACSADCQ
jgi:hypothetical protein